MKKCFYSIKLLLFVLLLISVVQAELFRVTLDAGISQENLTGTGAADIGFAAGLGVLVAPLENIQIGVRTAYYRWDIERDITIAEIKSTASIIELVPTLRLSTDFGPTPLALFSQFGIGLSVSDFQTEQTVSGFPLEDKTPGPYDELFMEETQTDVVMNLGGGLAIGRWKRIALEIIPLYHIVLTENGPIHFYSVNAGLNFAFL